MAVIVITSPLGINYASARAVSDQDIDSQEVVVRTASREMIEEYTRLLLYMIIFKLETRIADQQK